MELLSDKMTGGQLTADQWNQIPQEIENIITAWGQALTELDLNQLGKGVVSYASAGHFHDCSGGPSDYVLSSLAGIQACPGYFDGMMIRFVPNQNNSTGTITANVNGLGQKDIVRQDGLAFSVGTELNTTRIAELRYDLAADNFKLVREQNAQEDEFGLISVASQADVNSGTGATSAVSPVTLSGRTATETRTGIAAIATQVEVDAGVNDTKFVTPAKLSTSIGQSQSAFKTSDQTESVGTYTAVTDLDASLSMQSGVDYIFEADIVVFGGSPAISGIDLRFSASVTAARYEFIYRQENNNDFIGKDNSGSAAVLTLTDAEMPNVVPNRSMRISGYIRSNAVQDLTVEFKRNNTSGTITIRAGSWIKLSRVS